MTTSDRRRLRLYLTSGERAKLEAAFRESYAPSRSFLVEEAINHGLWDFDPTKFGSSGREAVQVWLPGEMKHKVRELARNHGFTQQSLIRHFLFQYLAEAPWRRRRR